jgi:hypothetical protein
MADTNGMATAQGFAGYLGNLIGGARGAGSQVREEQAGVFRDDFSEPDLGSKESAKNDSEDLDQSNTELVDHASRKTRDRAELASAKKETKVREDGNIGKGGKDHSFGNTMASQPEKTFDQQMTSRSRSMSIAEANSRLSPRALELGGINSITDMENAADIAPDPIEMISGKSDRSGNSGGRGRQPGSGDAAAFVVETLFKDFASGELMNMFTGHGDERDSDYEDEI